MSKAEQRAFEAYQPKYAKQERHPNRVQSEKVDTHQPMRAIFIKGYHQAEKDLALTIENIEKIHTFLYAIKHNKQGIFTFTRLSDEQYQEVLKRFNKLKEK